MDETKIVASLAALAHQHRLRIFRLLVKQGPSSMPAGEIADRIDEGLHEKARETLAAAIIAATREDSADVDLLRGAGLRAMARAFPDRLPPHLGDKARGTGSE